MVRGTLSHSVRLQMFGNAGKEKDSLPTVSEVKTYTLTPEELEKYRSLPKPEKKKSYY